MYRKERLAERDALAVAIDLFLLQGTLPPEELHKLFSPPSRDVLVRAGILEIDSTGVARARASLFPVGDRLIFSDHAWHKLPHPGFTIVPRDQVMFVGKDSRSLARATVRKPVRSSLDLCTGSGIQALLAATHSENVVAVDVNARAVRCASFNAQVSGSSNVSVKLGDLYEPLGSQRFDLITANPPFVPSPVDELQFRDGGSSGEDVQQRIVGGLPSFLAPGGIAQMVTELGEREDEPIVGRVRQWLGGAPMDILIHRLVAHSAADYAFGHANSDAGFGPYLESVGAWADNLRAQGYVRVISVLIAFQWSDPAAGPPWDRVDEARTPRSEAGSEVEATFARERAARKPKRTSAPDERHVSRAGPIALMESQVLGSQIRAAARATLLGQALSVEHQLDPVECEILRRLEKPIAMADLLTIAEGLNAEENAIKAAIVSLERRGLIAFSD